jgi:sarcosine oxidase delta subunit
VYDALQVSGECPYCGSNQVMEVADVNTMAPGGVVRFVVTAKEAADRFKAWIKKRLFCPKAAKLAAKPEKMTGVYLPYWTFDTDTTSQYTARYGIDHTRTDKDGKTHTETTWYHTSGCYVITFDDELVLATDRHDSRLLSGVEPYNTADNVAYKPEYLAGFTSERYSVGLRDAWERAKASLNSKIEHGIETEVRQRHHADRVDSVRFSTFYNNVTYKYLMLPVWMSFFKFKDKIYHFMVNGQTGRVSGRKWSSAWAASASSVPCAACRDCP